ncbi:hypothetical protein K1719_007492 [Acacia pycnantha]|nr:hypothetical protein K1719_007492 [Acacia pycnantha]
MKWRDKMTHPLRRAYLNFSARFGTRKSGLPNLQRDVNSCEYEDIQIMWEMLQRSEHEPADSALKYKKKNSWKMLKCASFSSFSS